MKFANTLDLAGNKATNIADGTNPQDAVSKAQLDAAVQGLKWKEPVRCTTTANITLSGNQSIDGVTTVANDRVLVKNQTTASTNGIYLAAAGAWTRAVDFDISAETLGASVFISEGTTQGNQQWQMSTDGPITIGTTSLTWQQFGGGGTSYTAGNGITLGGNVIAVDPSVVARKASATIGDGSSTVLTVTHNLNTLDVVTGVQLVSTRETVLCDVVANGVNTVQITFATAPAAGAYRATVIG
jgi:hypothetical protein